MRSTVTKRMAAALAAATLLAATGTFAASREAPAMVVSQPTSLSVQGGNLIRWRVEAPEAALLPVRFELRSLDGRVIVPVSEMTVPPSAGPAEGALEITPAHLAPFALGERVLLRGSVGPWLTEGDYVVVATSPAPEASGWTLNVPATAVVYSTKDSTLTFRTVNPKSKPLSVNLKLKFRNLKGKVVASWKYPVIALPGESVHSVTVPLSVCNQAKLKGANSLKTILLKDGDSKAQGQSLLDWDLVLATSSDKSAGAAPLNVSFTALVSGGVAPYLYDWDYGDGSAHGDAQSPNHVFLRDGVFSVVLRVVDSRGGIVTATPVVIAVQ